MIILGVTHPISHNNAACLLIDGELIAFAEEERFIRYKHAPHCFPHQAIEFCLQQGNIRPDQVDVTAIGFDPPKKGELLTTDIDAYIDGTLVNARHFSFFTSAGLLYHNTRIQSFGARHYFDHHLCHAASALIPSQFKSANIITLDGWGGTSSGLLGWCKEGGDIVIWRRISANESWGMVYELVTSFLGFRAHSGEGKTMGLAPYGHVDPDLLPDYCESELGLPDVQRYRDYLFNHYKVRGKEEELSQLHKNLAATIQYYYERSLKKIGKALFDKTGLTSFVLAGGVALNCTGNGALASLPFVEEIFIQPASHDAGTALGAAILAHYQSTGQWPTIPFSHAYWGKGYSQDAIKDCLRFSGAVFQEVDPCEAAAQALADNLLVGFFQGRAEVGPRALGNRSILANPAVAENLSRVNQQVKRRENWRPFAPSVLQEDYHSVVDTKVGSPFMIMAFQATEKWKTKIPAVVHIDGSCRPQTVSEPANSIYYRMIAEFKKRTDIPVVLNTSFNLEDEPIVNSPDHAIATFFRSGLEVLVMGDFVVRKKLR